MESGVLSRVIRATCKELITLELLDIVRRQSVPKPWAEGEKIPWNDADFSKRMLDEHLSQEHDAASRRFEIIDKHIEWIHNQVLKKKPVRILDLGCGPGLYTSRLARLGHQCVGIDFSPASIAYAIQLAEGANLDCTYLQQDIRAAEYGKGYGLVMLIFGEFNVFRPGEVRNILEKAYHALSPHGFLLLEPHTFAAVASLGEQPASWYTAEKGLFSDKPHLYLQENFWDGDDNVAIHRYYIIDAGSGEVAQNSSSMQAYTNEEYRSLLAECGFGNVAFYPSLVGPGGDPAGNLIAILSQRKAV
jgi:SAM-dependent methyltransferase